MLWSLIKILFFVALVVALTLIAGHLMETGSALRVSFNGVEYTLGPLQAVIVALVALFAVWLLLKIVALLVALVRFLNGDETALSRYFDRSREKRGYKALSEGMLALAAGEGRLALTKAEKADRLLDRPELTNLLSAQAAEMAGDKARAETSYKALLDDKRTRFVGVRGLMKQKLEAGDTKTAMELAERALTLRPAHEETADTLLQLQAESGDWAGARKTLAAKLKHGSLPRDVHKRRDAVLALTEANEVLSEGNTIEAKEEAIEANRLSPDLIPAAVMAARSYIEAGKPRYAKRVLRKAWEMQPHPDLAAAFAEIAPDETPQARLKRFEVLTKSHPEDPETKMLLAELYIAAEDFPAARRAIAGLVESNPTARVLTLMAAVERGEGSPDSVVRGWLTRALSAPRGPQWVCDNCQRLHDHWVPICAHCHGFDTLSWRAPEVDSVAMPSSTEMLPLLVGRGDAPLAEDADLVDGDETAAPTETVPPETEPVPEAETLADAEPVEPDGTIPGPPDVEPEPDIARDEAERRDNRV